MQFEKFKSHQINQLKKSTFSSTSDSEDDFAKRVNKIIGKRDEPEVELYIDELAT